MPFTHRRPRIDPPGEEPKYKPGEFLRLTTFGKVDKYASKIVRTDPIKRGWLYVFDDGLTLTEREIELNTRGS